MKRNTLTVGLVVMVAVLALAMLVGCSSKDKNKYGGPAGGGSGTGGGTPAKQEDTNKVAPNAIWNIKGAVKYRADLGQGIYDNVLLDVDFSKLDGGYPAGRYVGDVYVDSKIDASEYIKNFSNLVHGLASINFNVEGYGLRDQMPLTVSGLQDFEKGGNPWPTTTDASGKQVSPGKDDYVASTTFTMASKAKGTAGGQGDTGGGSFKLGNISASATGEEDVTLRFIIEPDSVWGNSLYEGTGGTRKVQIFVVVAESGKKSMTFSGEGTLTRQAGGSKNVQDYNSSHEGLGKKYGVDATH
ncbi:MAG: hypothetical protein FWF45_05460 [Coriobacteriia bacterium]|nr:hypothetical protein [Coriobacteriia bacterium]